MGLSEDDLLSVTIIPLGIFLIFGLGLCAFCCIRRRNKQENAERKFNGTNSQQKMNKTNGDNNDNNAPKQTKQTQQQITETFRQKSPPSETIHMTEAHNGTFIPYAKSQPNGQSNQTYDNRNTDDEFDHHGGTLDGRITSRSSGSNNSTIINVANEQHTATGAETTTGNELNQTVTSVKHVQLNENTHGGSDVVIQGTVKDRKDSTSEPTQIYS